MSEALPGGGVEEWMCFLWVSIGTTCLWSQLEGAQMNEQKPRWEFRGPQEATQTVTPQLANQSQKFIGALRVRNSVDTLRWTKHNECSKVAESL